MEAPVLLITFNRPDNTRKVFEKIKQAKIKTLYFFHDAPRAGNKEDIIAHKEIKKLLKEIDWECDLRINFQEKNLGCGYGVATAITWAFEKEERLIILEDDCVPSLPFFDFCNYCLQKYANDERIWVVSGRSHHENSKFFQDQDYIFSHYGHTWGWATWKRVWNHFDIDMKIWSNFYKQGGFLNVFCSKREGKHYNLFYKRLAKDNSLNTSAWDYQFGLSVHVNGGISITPAKNLIHNIGSFGTHTLSKQKCHILKASEDFKIKKEPLFVLANREYDLMHFKTHIQNHTPLILRTMNKIFRILGLLK